jgi:hypothetical protein
MRSTALFAAACAAAVALPARAQTPRESVLARLDSVARGGYVTDARPIGRASVLGELPREGSVRLEMTLRAGRRYRIVAACDRECVDLDLRAYSADGATVLAEDVEADARPVLSFVAYADGPHLLSVMMAGCRDEYCAFGVRVLAR